MLEVFLMSVGISLLYNFRKIKKKQGLDAELKELIESSDNSTGVALDIKNFLLRVIQDDKNDAEKFSDEQLAEAERIIDRAGSSAFYWMTDIAAQMTMLATAQLNGFPTNVSQELGDSATPEQVIDTVVKI
jgi:hypothetical protein